MLRLKLELDHGMIESSTEGLSPELENMWLKNIYKFEEGWKNSKPMTLFECLGKPQFVKWDKLSPRDISQELRRLKQLMFRKRVVLDCLQHYDDVTIYRFITEELFHAETMHVPGSNMVMHFIYEEFHPGQGN